MFSRKIGVVLLLVGVIVCWYFIPKGIGFPTVMCALGGTMAGFGLVSLIVGAPA
jgi:hypothetical protein